MSGCNRVVVRLGRDLSEDAYHDLLGVLLEVLVRLYQERGQHRRVQTGL